MSVVDKDVADRIEALERRVVVLEHQSISREALDEEIASVERRLGELREQEDG
jgi:chaperonin cofactor prefoldin